MKFAMTGRLDECLLLAYRTPAESVRHLVPAGLELLTLGSYAFWNVVACRVGGIRPAGLPAMLGISYHHVGYRLYVRCRTADGQSLDGLYFVRSDADSRLVCQFGDRMSDFRFHRSKIELESEGCAVRFDVRSDSNPGGGGGGAHLHVRCGTSAHESSGSPFATRADAAAFLKYRPLGLAPSPDGRAVHLAEVFRDEADWRESPVEVIAARWNLFDELRQHAVRLESATRVAPIDYRWRLGRTERLATDAV